MACRGDPLGLLPGQVASMRLEESVRWLASNTATVIEKYGIVEDTLGPLANRILRGLAKRRSSGAGSTEACGVVDGFNADIDRVKQMVTQELTPSYPAQEYAVFDPQ